MLVTCVAVESISFVFGCTVGMATHPLRRLNPEKRHAVDANQNVDLIWHVMKRGQGQQSGSRKETHEV